MKTNIKHPRSWVTISDGGDTPVVKLSDYLALKDQALALRELIDSYSEEVEASIANDPYAAPSHPSEAAEILENFDKLMEKL